MASSTQFGNRGIIIYMRKSKKGNDLRVKFFSKDFKKNTTCGKESLKTLRENKWVILYWLNVLQHNLKEFC